MSFYNLKMLRKSKKISNNFMVTVNIDRIYQKLKHIKTINDTMPRNFKISIELYFIILILRKQAFQLKKRLQ